MEHPLPDLLDWERTRFAATYPGFDAINRRHAFVCNTRAITAGYLLQCLTDDNDDGSVFTLARRTGQEAMLRVLLEAVVAYVHQHDETPCLPEPALIFGDPEARQRHCHRLMELMASLLETRLMPLAEVGYRDDGRGAMLLRQQAPWTCCLIRYLSHRHITTLHPPILAQQLARHVTIYTPQRQVVMAAAIDVWPHATALEPCILDYPEVVDAVPRLMYLETID